MGRPQSVCIDIGRNRRKQGCARVADAVHQVQSLKVAHDEVESAVPQSVSSAAPAPASARMMKVQFT